MSPHAHSLARQNIQYYGRKAEMCLRLALDCDEAASSGHAPAPEYRRIARESRADAAEYSARAFTLAASLNR